jgi:hypothetical protein
MAGDEASLFRCQSAVLLHAMRMRRFSESATRRCYAGKEILRPKCNGTKCPSESCEGTLPEVSAHHCLLRY